MRATKNGKMICVNTHNFEELESGVLSIVNVENRLFHAVRAVNQVENFCKKVGATLIVFPIISSEHLNLALTGNTCYVHYPYQVAFIDVGSDNVHPGPLQHRRWADWLTALHNRKDS